MSVINYKTAANAITGYFNIQWTALHPSNAPVAFDNLPFIPPADDDYLQFMIEPIIEQQVAIGISGVFRRRGRVTIAVMARAGLGHGPAQTLTDQVADIFRAKNVDGIVFRAPEITRVGVSGDRFRYNIRSEFHFDTFNNVG